MDGGDVKVIAPNTLREIIKAVLLETNQSIYNALSSVGIDDFRVDLVVDSVGLAKDATLNKIVGALASVNTDNILSVINGDNVGLAKDLTVSGIKSQTDKLSFDQLSYLNISYLEHIYDDDVTIDRAWSIPPNTFLRVNSVSISSGGVVYGNFEVVNRYINVPVGVNIEIGEGGKISMRG